MYLYNIGDYWVAFAKSAYMVWQMIEQADPYQNITVIQTSTLPFSLVIVHIRDMELQTLVSKLVLCECNEEYISFSTAMSLSFYDNWRKQVVSEY